MENSSNAVTHTAQRLQAPVVNGGLTPSMPNGIGRPASASPAALGPNGQPSKQRPRPRPKQQTNPLVANRRPPPRTKKPPQTPSSTSPANATNSQRTNASPPRVQPSSQKESDETAEPKGPFKEYPVTTTKRSLIDGLRYHVMRMHGKKTIDIYDEAQFIRPVRLHRRDPRHIPEIEEEVKETVEDDKERERQEILKEERRRVREANAAMTAPSVKPNKPAPFQKKTEQVFRNEDTPEAKKKAQLRYEEALPWHLEDFDNKNIWVGTYEAELSEHHVGLIVDKDTGAFKMIPFEKWYKFAPKSKGKIWTAEQAEERYSKKLRPPLWVQENEKVASVQREKARNRAANSLYTSTHRAGRGAGAMEALSRRGEPGGDMEDIDYNFEEDFADDEEGNVGLFEGEDEDTKIAEQKIKREQLGANVFGMTDEQKVWNEEDEEKKADELEKKLSKQTRKTLLKREKNLVYDDDEKENPYTSQSDYEDSETERQKDEEQKRADEERTAAEKSKGKEAIQPQSDPPTKGTNTLIERSKSSELKISSSAKRPGSPNLSEASGNESSRKKHKKNHVSGSGSANPSRNISPAPDSAMRKGSFTLESGRTYDLARRGAGSGSDTEATDGGKRRKIKLRLGSGSAAGSPDGSRAASPAAAANSRAASPVTNANDPQAQAALSRPVFPTLEEIQKMIPPEGTKLENILRRFKGRWTKEDRIRFMALLKTASRFEKESKMLYPKS